MNELVHWLSIYVSSTWIKDNLNEPEHEHI